MWIETTMPGGQRSRRGTSMMPVRMRHCHIPSEAAEGRTRSVSHSSRSPTAMRNGFSASTEADVLECRRLRLQDSPCLRLVPASSSRTIGGEKRISLSLIRTSLLSIATRHALPGRLERGE